MFEKKNSIELQTTAFSPVFTVSWCFFFGSACVDGDNKNKWWGYWSHWLILCRFSALRCHKVTRDSFHTSVWTVSPPPSVILAESACLLCEFTWLTPLCSIPILNFLHRSLQWLAGAFCLFFFNWCHVEHHLRLSAQLLSAASAATSERERDGSHGALRAHLQKNLFCRGVWLEKWMNFQCLAVFFFEVVSLPPTKVSSFYLVGFQRREFVIQRFTRLLLTNVTAKLFMLELLIWVA